MEVKLNIEGSDMSMQLTDILSKMSEIDKRDLAKELLTNWLREPVTHERKVFEEKLLDNLEEEQEKNNAYNKQSREKLKDSYDFRERSRGFKSIKEQMVGIIVEEAIKYYKDQITELIKNDSQMNEIFEMTKDTIKENYPKYVHDAMVYFLAGNMDSIKTGVQKGVMQAHQNQAQIDGIKQQIGIH